MSFFPHPSLPSPWHAQASPQATGASAWTQDLTPPVIWSIAGTDSGGGAGLSADTRAAAALGVHLCPVVAAVTAQNSLSVQSVHALPRAQVESQLWALAADLPPRVIKTGLLASVGAMQALADCIDALRADGAFVGLVVDPVLGATSGGAAFADEALVAAYRRLLLPRATLLTPNRVEAERLLGAAPNAQSVPELAAALRRLGPQAVCITGGDDAAAGQDLSLDWWDGTISPWLPELGATRGWLALPRLPTAHHHGSGCTFATAASGALARGFALPDAAIVAKMLTWCALRDGHAAGAGAGPLRPGPAFCADRSAMPVMSFGDEPLDAATLGRWGQVLRGELRREHRDGLYAISDDPARIAALAAGGRFAHLQLRAKRRPDADAVAEEERLRAAIREALAAARGAKARLWINDHWRLALAEGASALHLGQEDWAGLNASERALLLRGREDVAGSGLRLGLSSHSLWELARARGLAPDYIACGPVWPTTTKDMPWLPQGLAQLAWWVRMAGRPVVAIGGILDADRVVACRRAGASNVCLVRALDDEHALATTVRAD